MKVNGKNIPKRFEWMKPGQQAESIKAKSKVIIADIPFYQYFNKRLVWRCTVYDYKGDRTTYHCYELKLRKVKEIPPKFKWIKKGVKAYLFTSDQREVIIAKGPKLTEIPSYLYEAYEIRRPLQATKSIMLWVCEIRDAGDIRPIACLGLRKEVSKEREEKINLSRSIPKDDYKSRLVKAKQFHPYDSDPTIKESNYMLPMSDMTEDVYVHFKFVYVNPKTKKASPINPNDWIIENEAGEIVICGNDVFNRLFRKEKP
jgi:hypothetical protein